MFGRNRNNDDQPIVSTEMQKQDQTKEEFDMLRIEEKKVHNLQMKVNMIASFVVPVICVVLKEVVSSCLDTKRRKDHFE